MKPKQNTILDVQKVFDVVNHELLLRKLYLARIIENGWLLVRDIYKDMTLSVKWESQQSSPFVIRQVCAREVYYQRPITRGILIRW